MAGTVSLYKEITIEGKRKFVPINLGRGRQSEQPGSFYLRYHCPDKNNKNKRTWENVGQDFAFAKTARNEKEKFLKLRLSAGAAGIILPKVEQNADSITLQEAIQKYLEHIRERVTGLELRPLTLVGATSAPFHRVFLRMAVCKELCRHHRLHIHIYHCQRSSDNRYKWHLSLWIFLLIRALPALIEWFCPRLAISNDRYQVIQSHTPLPLLMDQNLF